MGNVGGSKKNKQEHSAHESSMKRITKPTAGGRLPDQAIMPVFLIAYLEE
jgi:hypothetical protein